MAKLGSFFRRFLSTNSSEDHSLVPSLTPLSPESPRSLRLMSAFLPSNLSMSLPPTITTRSCTVSPQPSPRVAIKRAATNTADENVTTNSNFLSSDVQKVNVRRLSAPLIIQTSTNQPPQYSATVVSEATEKALISSLHRLSTSSAPISIYQHNGSSSSSGNTMSADAANHGETSTSLLCRPEVRSASFNLPMLPSLMSNQLVHTHSLSSGTPPSQPTVGAQSSSARASIQSNHSLMHSSAMKETSPPGEANIKSNPGRKMSMPPRGRRPSMFDPIDPNELQHALYASAAAKSAEMEKPEDEIDPYRAISHIKLIYDRKAERVFIDSLSFENMPMLDSLVNNNINAISNAPTNGSNQDLISFYCRFRLCPERRSLFQTDIIRHPRSRSFHIFDSKELHDIELSSDQLINHSLEMILYRVGTTKPAYRDTRIASVKYDLEGLCEHDEISMKRSLDECDPVSTIQDPDYGNLLVSLSYLQSAAKLAVVVLEARSLRPLSVENKPFPEACVKVTLFDRNGKKLKRKKTSVQKASDCPTFNEELVFELRRDIAQEVMIELRVVHESLSYKEQLGAVTFGPAIINMTKGYMTQENVYWSMILSGESLNAQWQILKLPTRIEESK